MKISVTFLAFCAAGTLMYLAGGSQLTAQQGDGQALVGVEELAQGPIHEAFAQPGTTEPVASIFVNTAPPAPINELPPEEKPDGADVVWIPGYWAWDNTQYVWVSGTWRHLVPNHQWIPGYWHDAQGGWQWVAGYWAPISQTDIEILPTPPQAIVEAQPPAPSADSQFVPGHWVYLQQRYWWRSGFYVPYRPGWVWIPAAYCWTPGGTIFVEGHWDYDLDSRGLLYAPTAFGNDVYLRPGFYYRPRHAVFASLLFDSLFVSLGSHHYYFGNYYDPVYVQAGYQPWLSFRYNRYPDPLFNYYRWNHRNEPNWENNLRVSFKGRQEGNLPRPPRTIAEFQKNPVNKGGQASIVNVTNVNQVTINNKNVKLTKISEKQTNEIKTHTQQLRQVSTERATGEAKVASDTKKGGAGKFKLPVNTAFQSTTKVETPPAPSLPKLQSTSPDGGNAGGKGKGVDGKGKSADTKGKGDDVKGGPDAKGKGADTKTKSGDGKGNPPDTKAKGADTKTKGADAKSNPPDMKAKGTDTKMKSGDGKGNPPDTTVKGADTKSKASDGKGNSPDTKSKGGDSKGNGADKKGKSAATSSEMKTKVGDAKAPFPSDVKKGGTIVDDKSGPAVAKKTVPVDNKAKAVDTKAKSQDTKIAGPPSVPQKMPSSETKKVTVEKGKAEKSGPPPDVRSEKGSSSKKDDEKGKKSGWLSPAPSLEPRTLVCFVLDLDQPVVFANRLSA